MSEYNSVDDELLNNQREDIEFFKETNFMSQKLEKKKTTPVKKGSKRVFDEVDKKLEQDTGKPTEDEGDENVNKDDLNEKKVFTGLLKEASVTQETILEVFWMNLEILVCVTLDEQN